MLGAKDILVKIKGDNKQFKGTMTGANTSMKGFAATTASSSAVAATSTKAMALSMASSMAIATAGITLVIGGVIALAGALKAAVQGASDDADVTAQTTALLKQQGIAWNDVSGAVTNHIEALQNLTGFGDTELQESFNTFVASGMNVEDALLAVNAAAAVAASGEMGLATATKAVGKEYTTGTSKLKDYGIEADTFTESMKQISAAFGDGSQRAETLEGKMGVLTEAIMDQLKPLGAQLLPIMTSVLDLFIWGARNVLPPLIYVFQLLMLPIKAVISGLKQIYEVASAAWDALTGDWSAAEKHWNNALEIQKDYNKELKNTVLNIKDVSKTSDAIIPVTGIDDGVDGGVGGPLGGAGAGAGIQQSIGMQTAKRLQDIRAQGVTAEEYSGADISWSKIGQIETSREERAATQGEEEIINETKTQTEAINLGNVELQTQTEIMGESNILMLEELKTHSGLLSKILKKIDKPPTSMMGSQNSGA